MSRSWSDREKPCPVCGIRLGAFGCDPGACKNPDLARRDEAKRQEKSK